MASIVVIQASPRANGVSSVVADGLVARLENVLSQPKIMRFDVSEHDIKGCNGCEYCATHGTCIMQDAMEDLIPALLRADYVFLASPVYFSGAPAQFKAVLDRLQPLFWRRLENKQAGIGIPQKRPAYLYVVGNGGDPHGFEPLVSEVTSSLALADLRVNLVQSFIGDKPSKKELLSALTIPEEVFHD